MDRNDARYQAFLQILKEELVPAMGCTEPIAIAYGAAKAREVLGEIPDKVLVEASANIIKNVKSVVVPNTNGLKGIEAAAAVGIIAGKAEKVLEVVSEVSEEEKKLTKEYLDRGCIEVKLANTGIVFDIIITMHYKEAYVKLRISEYHVNIVHVEKNGEVLLSQGSVVEGKEKGLTDRSLLNVKDIIEFADTVLIEDVKETLSRQIEYNSAIAKAGIEGNYGANVGSVLLKTYGNDVKIRAKAMAAAGSDARMSGCELPVIINSGSGNQGMTTSLPVIEYAKELKVSEEKLYRALVISNLITLHLKTGIGRLSAFCGVICAGCGSGAGIAYLYGDGYEEIAHTIVNAVAIVSGIVCDGAKPSCAGKIASAVDAGILGYFMYKEGQQFRGGDGIVAKGVENTIANIGQLGKVGMKETDKEIINIMLTRC
ncbi:serine dehydratase subunit alpha family protein [Clostridium thailandense]|uniref:L-cysteine desulfidase family protein n=1 Tax=Clostridium thailandense TaxID=2794346 RepID=UPI003989B17D